MGQWTKKQQPGIYARRSNILLAAAGEICERIARAIMKEVK